MASIWLRRRYNERMPGGHQGDDVRPASSGVKLTYDDFLLFPDDGKRHELIDGEHYVTPSRDVAHQRVLGNLIFAVLSYLKTVEAGEIFVGPFDVVLSQHDVVAPDMLYLSHARAAKVLTPDNLRGAPELVGEILSEDTRKRDETIKRRLYERDDVSEYWVIDPELDSIRVYRRVGDQFGPATELTSKKGDATVVLRVQIAPETA